MSTLPQLLNGAQARAWVWWVVPAVVLAALIGWETDWGRQVIRVPQAAQAVDPKPIAAAVLPDYQIDGGLSANAETVNRTLFNATRRPAPALAGDGGPRTLRPGQFVLMGTTVSGERNIAFLKEAGGGKSRVVRQGEQINGMLVASVEPDHIKFTLGDESEELFLKVAPGPKTTVVAPPPPPGGPVAAAPASFPAAAAAARAAQAATAPAPSAQQLNRSARRAARQAAAAAAQGQGQGDVIDVTAAEGGGGGGGGQGGGGGKGGRHR